MPLQLSSRPKRSEVERPASGPRSPTTPAPQRSPSSPAPAENPPPSRCAHSSADKAYAPATPPRKYPDTSPPKTPGPQSPHFRYSAAATSRYSPHRPLQNRTSAPSHRPRTPSSAPCPKCNTATHPTADASATPATHPASPARLPPRYSSRETASYRRSAPRRRPSLSSASSRPCEP